MTRYVEFLAETVLGYLLVGMILGIFLFMILTGCALSVGPSGQWFKVGIWEGASLEVEVMGNHACLGCFETGPVEDLPEDPEPAP